MNTHEINEISQEDLEAAAEFYDKLVTKDYTVTWSVEVEASSPEIAAEMAYEVQTDDTLTTTRFQVVNDKTQETTVVDVAKPIINKEPKRPPFTVRVSVDIFYEIDRDTLPTWAEETGVEKLVEGAFDDYNKDLTLESLSKTGILGLEPVEISRGVILVQ